MHESLGEAEIVIIAAGVFGVGARPNPGFGRGAGPGQLRRRLPAPPTSVLFGGYAVSDPRLA